MGFNEDINAIQRQLGEGMERIVGEVVVAALSAVTLATPVGNPRLWENPDAAPKGYTGGTARGSWQVGIGSAPTGQGTKIDKSGSATIQKGKGVVSRYRLGPKVFIVSNAPHIVVLNNGRPPTGKQHSSQAPKGFVEKSIQAATNAVARSRGPLG